jgi:hypothetical protein
MTANAQSYRFCRTAFGSEMTLDAGSDRPASDSGGFNPFVDVSARPSPMSVAQSDVMRSWRLHSAFSFGGPVMQRGDGHAGDLMDFFGDQVDVSEPAIRRKSRSASKSFGGSGSSNTASGRLYVFAILRNCLIVGCRDPSSHLVTVLSLTPRRFAANETS